jgi:hypothetical protein
VVILIASANLDHFKEKRQGSQHQKCNLQFPFSNPDTDCTQFARLLKPDQFEDVTVDFDPATTLLSQTSLPGDSLEEWCRWTNGHFLSLSALLRGELPDKLVADSASIMSMYFDKHVPFYLAVLKMFKRTDTPKAELLGVAQLDWDQRFIGSEVQVSSPLFLQAFERSLALGPPPESFYDVSQTDLLNKSPSEIGFAVERECLQDKKLLQESTACLKVLGQEVPDDLLLVRIGFRNIQQVINEAGELFKSGKKAWAVHAIPLKWNEKSIDGLQFYFVDSKLFAIGNSISLQTAREHAKSLVWLDELQDVKTSLDSAGFADVHFVLLFTAKQADDKAELRVHADRVSAARQKDLTISIMDFPITSVMGQTSANHFKMDTSMKSYGARVLTLGNHEEEGSRVRVQESVHGELWVPASRQGVHRRMLLRGLSEQGVVGLTGTVNNTRSDSLHIRHCQPTDYLGAESSEITLFILRAGGIWCVIIWSV